MKLPTWSLNICEGRKELKREILEPKGFTRVLRVKRGMGKSMRVEMF
jgi:hypothetical protein